MKIATNHRVNIKEKKKNHICDSEFSLSLHLIYFTNECAMKSTSCASFALFLFIYLFCCYFFLHFCVHLETQKQQSQTLKWISICGWCFVLYCAYFSLFFCCCFKLNWIASYTTISNMCERLFRLRVQYIYCNNVRFLCQVCWINKYNKQLSLLFNVWFYSIVCWVLLLLYVNDFHMCKCL